MRIGGLVSTEKLDLQGERILSNALNFDYFMKHGWLNDDHKKGQTKGAVVGYPTSIDHFSKGVRMPNGKTAPKSGWYVEGYLVDTEAGREMFELALSLKDTGRSLGFSVEGKIADRKGGKVVGKSENGQDIIRGGTIRKAYVTNIAVTHKPVNTDTFLEVLTKSLTAGHGDPTGAKGTPGDGSPLRGESLDDGYPANLEFSKGANDMDGTDELTQLIGELDGEAVDVAKSLEGNEDLVKAVNVTPFLKSLVDQTTAALGEVNESLQKSTRLGIAQAKLVKALYDQNEAKDAQIETLEKSLADLDAKIEKLGDSPVLRKGVTDIKSAEVAARQFAGPKPAAGGVGQMTKSDLLDIMMKSVESNMQAGHSHNVDKLEKAIIRLEGRNVIDPSVISLLGLTTPALA